MVLIELLKSPWLALLTFLIGLLVGHRTALWRDRRKEFNDAAAPVRSYLLAESKEPSPYRQWPSADELDLFEQCLGWQRRGFRKAWCYQQQVRDEQTQDGAGFTSFKEPGKIGQAVKRCLGYTALR